jgi:hypothetical protein
LYKLNYEILSILPDWTAEDYALDGGHHDVAAELKSPSDRVVLSFTEKSVESQQYDTGVAPAKRSFSDASPLCDQQKGEKEVRAWSAQMTLPMVEDISCKVGIFELSLKYTSLWNSEVCCQLHKSLS